MEVTLATFETEVLMASTQTPVLLQFWAPWCGPCQTLKPLLEQLETEYAGRFKLAQVNADDNPEIAAHFQVRSIPYVVAFVNGQPVDHFQGVLPDSELRAFLDRLVPAPAPTLAGILPEAVAEAPVEPEADPATPQELALATRLAEQPTDLAGQLELAQLRRARGAWAEAMDALLEIVARDRSFQDDIGRRTLLEVFGDAAEHPALVSQYRRRLSSLLF